VEDHEHSTDPARETAAAVAPPVCRLEEVEVSAVVEAAEAEGVGAKGNMSLGRVVGSNELI
jgi:hypothetical protein